MQDQAWPSALIQNPKDEFLSVPYAAYTALDEDTKRGEARPKKIPWSLYFALLLCFVLIIFTICVVRYQIDIATPNEFPNNLRTLYVTGITALSTLISVFITSAVRNQWLRHIDHELENSYDVDVLKKLNTSWRSNLGLLSFKERVARVSTWPNQLLYVITALIATALVAATIPTSSTSVRPYFPRIPLGDDNNYAAYQGNAADVDDRTTWENPTGKPYMVSTDNYGAPAGAAVSLVGNINKNTPELYAYALNGVAVHPSAIGAPAVLFSENVDIPDPQGRVGTVLKRSLAKHRNGLLEVSQCAPVLTKNPVSCRRGGKVKLGNKEISAISENGTCVSWTPLQFRARSTVMSSTFCPKGQPGAGIAVLGGQAFFAVSLAVMLGDIEWFHKNRWAGNTNDLSYAVTCDVDVESALAWRNLTLKIQYPYSNKLPYRQFLFSEEPCSPSWNRTLGTAYAATAAAGLGPPLWEGAGWDGQLTAIFNAALNYSGNPMAIRKFDPATNKHHARGLAFSDSRNPLEDVLGLITGLVMSQINIANPPGANHWPIPVPTGKLPGSQVIAVVRVGTGHRFAYAYVLPPLLTILFSLWLLLRTPLSRPTYSTSQLPDILEFGQGRSGYYTPASVHSKGLSSSSRLSPPMHSTTPALSIHSREFA